MKNAATLPPINATAATYPMNFAAKKKAHSTKGPTMVTVSRRVKGTRLSSPISPIMMARPAFFSMDRATAYTWRGNSAVTARATVSRPEDVQYVGAQSRRRPDDVDVAGKVVPQVAHHLDLRDAAADEGPFIPVERSAHQGDVPVHPGARTHRDVSPTATTSPNTVP